MGDSSLHYMRYGLRPNQDYKAQQNLQLQRQSVQLNLGVDEDHCSICSLNMIHAAVDKKQSLNGGTCCLAIKVWVCW